MTITATELKENLGFYLSRAATEEILISRHGKPIAKLTGINNSRSERMQELFGILPSSITTEDARAIREEEKWGLC